MSLLNRYLPDFQFAETHDIRIQAPMREVLDLAMRVDLGDDPIVAALLRIRGLPARLAEVFAPRERPETWRHFGLHRFTPLGRDADREIAYGLVGQFWKSAGGLVRIDSAEHFAAYREPGVPKLVMSFAVDAAGDATRLRTVTRVHCPDDASRRRFTPYWLLIRPASGWIRRRALKRVKLLAEARP
jgi:hypothetical protein